MSRRSLIVSATVAVLLNGCGSARRGEPMGAVPVLDTPAELRGQRVSMRLCTQYHNGGAGSLGPAINDKPLPGFLIRVQVRQGFGAMPSFSKEKISDAELDDLIVYLHAPRRRPGDTRMIPAVATRRLPGRWPYLQLMRPANLVTAAADVLAGYTVAGLPPPQVLPLLLLSGVLLYAGGVVMNDVFDARRDRYTRPERPIPSGRARRRTAAAWGLSLLTAGVAAAFAVGTASGVIASVLALAALLYDAVAKHYAWLGPVAMGACRGLNLLLGVSAAPAALLGGGVVALVPLLYVSAITLASRGEVDGGDRRTVALAIVMIAMAIALLVLLTQGARPALIALAPFAALLAVCVSAPLLAAWRRPNATRVRAAVKRGILSIIVVDAAIAAAHAGFLWGVVLLILAVPASQLSARFAVT